MLLVVLRFKKNCANASCVTETVGMVKSLLIRKTVSATDEDGGSEDVGDDESEPELSEDEEEEKEEQPVKSKVRLTQSCISYCICMNELLQPNVCFGGK